jgi:predicted regulator of Ras-like GTPase activity (Roadblock/LC7/MglB family)
MGARPLHRHWLADRLDKLDSLARERDHRRAEATRGVGDESMARTARDEFLRAIELFAREVSLRNGVISCVIGHEGLLLATAGSAPDAETLAAVSQVWLAAGNEGVNHLGIGRLNQMVVVGDTMKVALFQTGGMSIAILAATGSDLSTSLADP